MNKAKSIDDVQNALVAINSGRLDALVAALGNWVSITSHAGDVQNAPHSQTPGGLNICVAAVTLVPQVSGIFFLHCRLGCSDNTAGGVVTHQLFTHQGATATGTLAGGAPTGVFGSGVVAAGSHGEILNSDGAGGPGVTFEGNFIGGPVGELQYREQVPTLGGLLTAQGASPINFGFSGIVNANGVTTNTKTPFTKGLAVGFGIVVSATVAHVVSYESLEITAIELPVG